MLWLLWLRQRLRKLVCRMLWVQRLLWVRDGLRKLVRWMLWVQEQLREQLHIWMRFWVRQRLLYGLLGIVQG